MEKKSLNILLVESSSSFSLATEEEPQQQTSKEPTPSLPKEIGRWPFNVTLHEAFWCPDFALQGVMSFQKHFHAQDQDIILASKPKSGTTWLKALIFSIVNRNQYTSSNTPLLTSNPHQLVPFFEVSLNAESDSPDLTTMSTQRLFATHIPYASLPESIKQSKCRIVYVCRNPFDTLVSFWHFTASAASEYHLELSMEELVDNFCQGKDVYGPFWKHVLSYWNESLQKPNKVLFLKYEDLKEDTNYHVKRLAKFVGFPFSSEEEKKGVIKDILKLCSLKNLKDLEVNKNGKWWPFNENKDFFRKGEVGDWVNHLSPAMVERMNTVLQDKLSGSGLNFRLS